MTVEEQILILADALNQTLMHLDQLAYEAGSYVDLTNFRRDLLKERENIAKVINEYDKPL